MSDLIASIQTPLAPVAFLENSDLPNLGAVVAFSTSPSTPTFAFEEPKRVSRLPPLPTVAGPSQYKRYYYIAVRRGRQPGVYNSWTDAERQILVSINGSGILIQNHPDPFYKTFSTRLAAEAFVAGWDGAGRHALPPSSPRPLREHLAMSFPSAVPMPHSKRPTYHSKLLSIEEFGGFSDVRPPLTRPVSWRNSTVRVSSPLRQQVDDETPDKVVRKSTSLLGIGGLMSPPSSPLQKPQRWSVMERERPIKPHTGMESGQWAASPHRDFGGSNRGPLSPPTSPPASPRASASSLSLKLPPRASPLWADPTAKPPRSSPLGLETVDFFEGKSAPKKFSRSSLRNSGVVMPVAAPRSNSSSSLSKSMLSHLNASTTSLSSISLPRKKADRLSTLAENTRRELQLNEEGFASASLTPPRPAFMRKTSSSSLASDSSDQSMGSLTSASSVQSSSLESYPVIEDPIVEEPDVIISCTKSDGDAEGSVESSSLKSAGTIKKKGGLFKRFSKALKIEKKADARRPSM